MAPKPRQILVRLGQSQIVRLSASSSALRAASLGATIVTSIVLARMLGPSGLGHYSYALAVIAVIGLPIHVGLPTLIIRETARGEADEDWGKVRGLWQWAGRRVGVISVVIMACAAFAFTFFGDRLVDADALPTILIGLLLVPLFAIANLRGAAARGLHRPVLGILPDAVIRPLILLALLLAYSSWHRRIGSEAAIGLHVIAASVAMLAGMVVLYRITPAVLRTALPDQSPKPAWRRSLMPLALLAGTQVLMQNANTLILGAWETPEHVGFFKIAVSASNLAAIGLTAVDLIIAPIFVRLHSQGKMDALQREASKAAALSFAMALPVAVVFYLAGGPILAVLYGADFVPAYAPMMILLTGQVVNAFCGSCGHLLNMAGHERISLALMILAMIANISLNLLLIPSFGLMGAATATAISLALLNVGIVIAIRRKVGIAPTLLGILHK